MAADIVDAATRSRMMAGIKGKNTQPELAIRQGLHKLGFRYLLHDKRLPGTPDLVLPKWKVVILIHGCFWHGHDCPLYKQPKTRQDFWRSKIARNRERDTDTERMLAGMGWRVSAVSTNGTELRL